MGFKDSLVIFGNCTQLSPVATHNSECGVEMALLPGCDEYSLLWRAKCYLVVGKGLWKAGDICLLRGRACAMYDSVALCHWTQVVAVTADNYRCFQFVSALFPELCVLAHFKRSKQPTISMLISKQQR